MKKEEDMIDKILSRLFVLILWMLLFVAFLWFIEGAGKGLTGKVLILSLIGILTLAGSLVALFLCWLKWVLGKEEKV